MRETSRGPKPLPRSSNTVCSASATPRTSGSFTFSSVALHINSCTFQTFEFHVFAMYGEQQPPIHYAQF